MNTDASSMDQQRESADVGQGFLRAAGAQNYASQNSRNGCGEVGPSAFICVYLWLKPSSR
jgi:hypothetical protein